MSQSFGSVLRALRESLGFSRATLADKCDLSELSIRSIECDTHQPAISQLSALRRLPELAEVSQLWASAGLLSSKLLRQLVRYERDLGVQQPTMARGFKLLPIARRQEIARLGGVTAHLKGTAHKYTSAEAREAGKIGGKKVSADREHMRKIGRSGGLRRQQQRAEQSELGAAE